MFPPPPDPPVVHRMSFDKHTIETPEQMGLDFAVAGVGSRFLALAIDTLAQVGIGILALIFVFTFGLIVSVAGLADASIWLIAAAGFAVFMLLFGYFAIFEIAWNGQTPGKRIMGLRVIKDSGRPLTAAETIGRNLMRIVDQMPGFYAIGVLTALLNARNKRLGDFVAGSLVVRESAISGLKAPWRETAGDPVPFTAPGANSLALEDLTLIETFLHRRNDMEPDVRSKMAAQIVTRLRTKMELPDADEVPAESLLETLARQRRQSHNS